MVPLVGATVAETLLPNTRTSTQQGYTRTSWGLGVVVPDGCGESGGGALNWADVTNTTAVVHIPEITNASAPVYAVLSVMTEDGVVLQAAFGVYPGNESWLVYAMYIENINQVPQHYTWVVNSSEPTAEPGDVVTISIYQSAEHLWGFRASNANTSDSVQRAFGTNSTQPPKVGDQEVFALESYASDSATFRNMGNMTLVSLLADGQRVESGWYLFADWDLLHNPLFVVGGASPAPFVDDSIMNDGRVVWYYYGVWTGGGQFDEAGLILVAMLILAGAALGAVLLVIRYMTKAAGSQGQRKDEERLQDQNRLK